VTVLLVALLSVPAPEAGEIDQLTPVAPGSYCTDAVSTCELAAGTRATVGETDTILAGTVRTSAPDTEVCETDVAVIVTVTSLGGGLAGAW